MNLQLTTGRLYWRPNGETSWIDFGNCQSYKAEPDFQRVEHKSKRRGVATVDLEVVSRTKTRWTLMFDEQWNEVLRLIYLSLALTDANLGQQTGATSQFTPTVGRSYFLGFYGVTVTSAVDALAAGLVEGTHYLIDTKAGVVTVLAEANAGQQWTITFNAPAASLQTLKVLGQLFTRGRFKLVETDQTSPVPFNVEEFEGQVWVTGYGDENGEQFSEFTVEVLYTP